jgi:signal peptidase II
VSDQLLKQWVVANYTLNQPSPIIGDWFRINFVHNNGGLFGLFQGQALIFAAVTVGVVAVLAAIEVGSGWKSWILTLTLGLLLGGAVGNFIDRLRYGYVVDFVDIGIGGRRFYYFNVADSAVTVAILLMLGLWFLAPYLGIQMPGDKDPGAEEPTDAGKVEAR